MRLTRQEKLTGFAFTAPGVLLVTLFVVWPTIHMFWTSAHRTTRPDTETTFVGVDNYTALLQDPSFAHSLRNTLLFCVLVVPIQTCLALAFACWVNGGGWSRRFLRLCLFLPTTLSLAVLSVVWKLLYAPEALTGAGLINGLLASANLPTQPFLTNPYLALPSLIVMSIWQGVGLQIIVFLAGLQAIPEQLYEAATLDGAGHWQRFLNVTLPGVAPTAVFIIMVTTIFSLRLFVQPYLMTGGGPAEATISLVQYVYEAAFHARDFGLACAAGSVFFLVVLAATLGLRRLLSRAEMAE